MLSFLFKMEENDMTIQWYPGHMAKAMREFKEKLKLVDIVYELRDARVPMSSQNPEIDQAIGDKPRIILLMKSDLADQSVTDRWLSHFANRDIVVAAIDAKNDKDIVRIHKLTEQVLANKIDKRLEKGMKEGATRAIIVGVPNVGKSTLINRMARKKSAKTGNTPGVTQRQQWIKLGKNLELLDTPGILWPKFQKQEIGYRLAITGAIPNRLLYMDDVALYAMKLLDKYYPAALAERYKLTEEEARLDSVNKLLAITRKRGMQDDYERAAEMIITEIRKGLLGRVSFDRVGETLWEEVAENESTK